MTLWFECFDHGRGMRSVMTGVVTLVYNDECRRAKVYVELTIFLVTLLKSKNLLITITFRNSNWWPFQSFEADLHENGTLKQMCAWIKINGILTLNALKIGVLLICCYNNQVFLQLNPSYCFLLPHIKCYFLKTCLYLWSTKITIILLYVFGFEQTKCYWIQCQNTNYFFTR